MYSKNGRENPLEGSGRWACGRTKKGNFATGAGIHRPIISRHHRRFTRSALPPSASRRPLHSAPHMAGAMGRAGVGVGAGAGVQYRHRFPPLNNPLGNSNLAIRGVNLASTLHIPTMVGQFHETHGTGAVIS